MDGFPKKVAVLLDFVQMRGGAGGPCPNFFPTLHKLYLLGQFGDGEGVGDPCPIFFSTLTFKKSGTSWVRVGALSRLVVATHVHDFCVLGPLWIIHTMY